MDVKATLETRTSKEGKEYKCVVIKISNHSEKVVFLNPAELELLEMNSKKSDFDLPDLR